MKGYKVIFLVVLFLFISFGDKSVGASGRKYRITVNKATNCVTIYRQEGSGEFLPFKAMICSVGANDGTPAGSFYTKEKYRWRPLFGDVYGQYATRIEGDILFHSVYYKEESPSSLKAEEYNKLGQSVSMGCVRLTVADAKWIYENCSEGTRVDIVENGVDPLPRPEAMKLYKNAKYPNWDPTDDDKENPWKKEGVSFECKSFEKTIVISEGFNIDKIEGLIRYGVVAYDTTGNPIEYEIGHNIIPNKVGRYEIRYFATDKMGSFGDMGGYLNIVEE